MKLFIQPNDVLFFRDGRPFDAGGDHVARLLFPPTPVTFYGAIRAALIGQLGSFQKFRDDSDNPELKNIVGYVVKKTEAGQQVHEAVSGSLVVSDFGLARMQDSRVKRIFSIPLDIAMAKTEGNEPSKYFVLSPEKLDKSKLRTNLPKDDLCLLSNLEAADRILESPSGFLSEEGLRSYLFKHQVEESHFLGSAEVFQREYRVGIERSTTTLTAEEGQLYSIEFARLKRNVGFIVELTGMNGVEQVFARHSLLRLGGESRSACYRSETWNPITTPEITNGRFKVVLLTPAIFSNGWIPDGLDVASLKGTIAGCSVKLVAAAVGRPIGIGGWDILARRSKPMRRAVPAGSVYYFECLEKNKAPSVEASGFIHIGDEQFTKQGLGQATIGTWNYIGEQ